MNSLMQGHHAEPDNGNGYCIYNNIAIAAAHLLNKYPGTIKKVAIVDFDVHHGNGTQKIFYSSPDVLFISIHQDRNYPKNTGFVHEVGESSGVGYNINVPLPPGSGSQAYRYTMESVVKPILVDYHPDFILVSCGLDCSYMDPLGTYHLISGYHII